MFVCLKYLKDRENRRFISSQVRRYPLSVSAAMLRHDAPGGRPESGRPRSQPLAATEGPPSMFSGKGPLHEIFVLCHAAFSGTRSTAFIRLGRRKTLRARTL